MDDSPRELTDAASLLEPMPGVYVRRQGADDAFSTLSIRGSSSSEVAVVLAGVPLTGGADPSLDLATLPLWPGARARVYRSFAPGSLGPGSLGGTLVLDPPSVNAPQESEVWAAVGSYGAARMRVADIRALDPDGRTRLVTALSASRASDGFTYFSPASPPGQQTFVKEVNAGHAAVNGLASLATPVSMGSGPDATLSITTLAQMRRQEIPGTIYAPTPTQTLESNRELASVGLTVPTGGRAQDEWRVRAWGRRDDLRLTFPGATPALGPTHTNDSIYGTGGALGWSGKFAERASLDAQLDGSAEWYAPAAWVGAATPPSAARTSLGAAVDGSLQATKVWSVSATARADAWNDASDSALSSSHAQLRPTGHVGTDVRVGPVTLSAHGGAVARAPSFVERYGDRGAFIGDPNLLPESAWTVDTGARAATSRSAPVRAHAEVAGFTTWATNLIVFVPEGAFGQAHATNIGRARMMGFEGEGAIDAGEFELRAAYTLLSTANESVCAAQTGSFGVGAPCDRPQLPGRPTSDLVADASDTIGPVRVRYGVDAVTGMIADQVGTVVVPPRVLQSAGARMEVPGVRGLRVAVDVRNVFDVRIGTYAGATGPVREPIGDAFEYPVPGRTVLATALWKWGE